MDDVQEAKGIKLFGTTISLQTEKPKNETIITDQDPTKSSTNNNDDESLEKKPDKIVPCPRCKSMETKFCYFNNYNVNQPRHFCKGCQRYWTAGGALRNVPVGAGRRKTKPPDVQRFDFEAVAEQWQQLAYFEHVFPAKRRRSISGGQSC